MLYHVVSSESLSKYDFGIRLAQRFDLDTSLINPTSVKQVGAESHPLTQPHPCVQISLLVRLENLSPGFPQVWISYTPFINRVIHKCCTAWRQVNQFTSFVIPRR